MSKNHPGYLYYKELLLTNKKNKKRSLTGKTYNRKIKLDPISKHKNKNLYLYRKFPKINNNSVKNMISGKQTFFNHKTDRNNPYSPFWASRILNRNDCKIEIKGMAYGVPVLAGVNKNDDYLFKIFNKEKEKENKNNNIELSKKNSIINYNEKLNVYRNNFLNKKDIKHSKGKKPKKTTILINNKNINKKIDIINNLNNDNIEINNFIKNNENKKEIKKNIDNIEDFDEEKEKQFYTNQKNFFKFRKDIIEEPEYLEEDNDINDNNEEKK